MSSTQNLAGSGTETSVNAITDTPEIHATKQIVRLFRVVGLSEFDDLGRNGVFRLARNTMEGKWFADSEQGANCHAKMLYRDQECRIVAADVSNDVVKRMHKADNLDGCGPATYFEEADLSSLIPRFDG